MVLDIEHKHVSWYFKHLKTHLIGPFLGSEETHQYVHSFAKNIIDTPQKYKKIVNTYTIINIHVEDC